MKRPNWTILYNIDCGEYIGTAWEFYNDENVATKRYNELNSNSSKYCATKRPYHHKNDWYHLGAANKSHIKRPEDWSMNG